MSMTSLPKEVSIFNEEGKNVRKGSDFIKVRPLGRNAIYCS